MTKIITFRCPDDLVAKIGTHSKTDLIVKGLRNLFNGTHPTGEVPADKEAHNQKVQQIVTDVAELLMGGKAKQAAVLLAEKMEELFV